MLRYLLLGILVYIIVKGIYRILLARSYLRKMASSVRNGGHVGTGAADGASRAPDGDTYGEMVRCSSCGTFVDKSTAEFKNGEWVCSAH